MKLYFLIALLCLVAEQVFAQSDNLLLEREVFRVDTVDGLIDALKKARSGQVVYIDDSAQIDMSGHERILIPKGVTLASGGDAHGLGGALVFSNAVKTYPLFQTGGKNVRVTGMRIQGPDSSRRTKQMSRLKKLGLFYSIPNSRGILVTHEDVKIDNCELWGWSHAAIVLFPGAVNAEIRNNYLHHNQRYGLGYGVVLDKATALIEFNKFDWNRHSISATGRSGTSYHARYNIVGQNGSSHAFDMHGGKDRKDGTNIAGTKVLIENNIFYMKEHPAIVIRGRPEKKSIIENNCFSEKQVDKAIRQINAKGNLVIGVNQLGNCDHH